MDFKEFVDALKGIPVEHRPQIEAFLSDVVDALFDQGEEAANDLAGKAISKLPEAYQAFAQVFVDSVVAMAAAEGEDAVRKFLEDGLDKLLGEDDDDVLG
jgi:hypothetical protein